MAKTLVTDTDISLSSLHQQLLIKPAASNDSTTVVQIRNSAGTVVLNVDTTNNRVGIGTATPGWALQVVGQINIPDSHSYIWGAGTSWISGSSASNFITLNTNLTERVRVTSTGNVGIGTTSPGNKLSILDPSSTTNGQLRLGYSDTYYWDIGRENTVNGRFSFINKQNNTPSELVSILTSGNFGIGTTSPAYALDVSGVIRSSNGILNTNNTFEKVFSSAVNFPNGTANQAVDIRLGNLAIGGYIEVELNSTYANQPSYGKLTKLFAIGTNPNNAIYTNESRVSDALGTVPDNVAIGDISWDATNSVYKIPISHIVSTGNQYTIKVRMFADSFLAKPVFDAMTVSSIYTLTALPRNYVNYNGNVGIGTATPVSKLDITDTSNANLPIVSIRNTNGYAPQLNFDTYGYLGTPAAMFSVLNLRADYAGAAGAYVSFNVKLQPQSTAVTAMTILGGGNVGIGTTSPGALLHVSKDQNTQTDIRFDNPNAGTAASALFDMRNGALGINDRLLFGVTGTGYTAVTGWGDAGVLTTQANISGGIILNANAGGIKFETSANGLANQRMVIDNTGNVGIGITTPGYKLQVVGSSNTEIARVGDGTRSFGISTYTPNSGGVTFRNAGTGLISLTAANAVLIGTGYAGLGTGVSANTVAIEGNVGIGTIAPNVRLDVLSGSVNTAADSLTASTMTVTGPNVVFGAGANYAGVLNVETNDTLGANVGGSIGFGGRYTGTAQAQWALIKGAKENATDGDIASYLAFGTRAVGTQVTERMRITSTGNVGIGTVSPTVKLQVAGGKILLDNTQGIQIKDATGTARTVLQVDGGDNLYLDSTAAGGDIYLRASGNDKLTIKATSGNVGIGTSTPTSKLAVNGALALKSPTTVNAATYTMASTDSSLIITTTNCTITLLSAATYTGRILYIKNITEHSLTSNASNVVPLGSATAGTAILAATAGKFAMLQSDGTNWITMMSN